MFGLTPREGSPEGGPSARRQAEAGNTRKWIFTFRFVSGYPTNQAPGGLLRWETTIDVPQSGRGLIINFCHQNPLWACGGPNSRSSGPYHLVPRTRGSMTSLAKPIIITVASILRDRHRPLSKSRWPRFSVHMHLGHPLSDIPDHRVVHHSVSFGRDQELQVLKQMWEENREHVFGTIRSKGQDLSHSVGICYIPRDEIALLPTLTLSCRSQHNIR